MRQISKRELKVLIRAAQLLFVPSSWFSSSEFILFVYPPKKHLKMLWEIVMDTFHQFGTFFRSLKEKLINNENGY